ncbi:hypothetical protein EDD21DRAFT_377786 [Dissophora ornata]|nr:hypothetical protein EDD21DRAFT_377786 [Dissophora ornata]
MASVTRTPVTDLEDEEGQSELYNAVLDSQVALDTVVADWISLYERSKDEALLTLTNFLIRCCGCKQFISAGNFEDQDNIVKTLQAILLRYKKTTTNFDYPIVSKAKEFKKFRKNLLEFYSRLIQKAQNSILFDGVFMKTLLAWTVSLSSSTFRPVRHTAAAVALSIVTSLAEIASELQDELNVSSRQLATSQRQKAPQTKIKQLEKKVAEAQSCKADVFRWIDDIFDSVYVLRCRDVDPLVRLDCVHELGQWMASNPDHFIVSTYLRYLGYAIPDKSAAVRLEALKVLAKLYEIENQPIGLRQITTKHTDRLIDMAFGESDTPARLGAIRVVTLIHKHGQLEEEEQVRLSTLIFGANAKVRKSLAKFVKARVWEDEVEGRMANCELLAQSGETPVRKDWVELKSLVSFLIKVGKTEAEQNGSMAQDEEHTDGTGTRLFDETKVGRVALAVEALWSEIGALKNWKSIAEYLLKDHTAAPTTSSLRSGRAKAASLEDAYNLEEEEENILLEIFIASLQLTLNPPAVPGFQKDKAKLKAQQDDVANEVGGYCINVVPQLFLKYGVDSVRIRSVLAIPQLVPLNVYVDMRMLGAYEELVDEVIKVFKKHSDPSVLSAAALTLRTMQGYELLRTSHEGKIEALGATIVDTFLTVISQDVDAADRVTLEELTPCLRRLEHLVKCTDLTIKRSHSSALSPFDGLLKVVKRYRTVSGQDAEVMTSALTISFLWISWLCRGYAAKYDQNADWKEDDVQELLHVQESLVHIVLDLATKDVHDIDPRVRRRAFQILGDIYWLFGGDMFHSSKGTNRHMLYMTCPESTQAECEEFLRSELDLWDEKVQEKMKSLREARISKAPLDGEADTPVDESESEDERDDATDEAEVAEDEKLAAEQIEHEDKYEMFGTVFSFMRQIMLKDFSMGHATAVIARYGRFGAEYDEGVKRVVASIKAQTAEGLTKQARDQKAEVFMGVCLDSLEESFDMFMNRNMKSANHSLQLAKVLSTAIKPPGFMQARSAIDVKMTWNFHKRGIVHVLDKTAGYERIEHFKNKAKMLKFFDVLSHMPFGPQTAMDEITNLQEVVKFECERRQFEVDDGDVWEPLRSYQSKLEKMKQRAVTEHATAVKKAEEAARLRDEQQQKENDTERNEEQGDIEMATTNGERIGAEALTDLVKVSEKTNSKKRQAEDEDEDEDEEVEDEEAEDEDAEAEAEADQASRSESASGHDDEDEPAHKVTKRIRVR